MRLRAHVGSRLALLALFTACAPAPYKALPSPDELNHLDLGELYTKFPELDACGPKANAAAASAITTRSAKSLAEAWGKPDETSLSALNLMIWLIPLAPVTTWKWTHFDRDVEITVWHPLAHGYRAAVWVCDFGSLRPR